MKSHAKILPKFRQSTSTGCRISKNYCRGEEEEIAGSGQGNRFSGNVYRDLSCLMISSIEKDSLGVNFEGKETFESKQCVSARFGDNRDLIEDRENMNWDMWKITNKNNSTNNALRGYLE